ncbi:MAG TPA: glutamine synthetase family protein [Candidatus Angelobacter sp.]|nr:glutamine synthetase family protein [Candidatus Angelobacter sp.]
MSGARTAGGDETRAVDAVLASAARYVQLRFVDLFGVLKSVNVPATRFAEVLRHGEWFDGSSVDGFARVLEDDMYLVPDLATLRTAPADGGGGSDAVTVFCRLLTPDGEVSVGDSREVLRRVLDGARDRGFDFHTGPEVEFFLFDAASTPPVPADHGGYFDEARDGSAGVREAMVDVLQRLGVAVDGSHHEVSPGQHEIDVAFQPALAAADAVVLLRHTARAVAQQHGLRVSFMPKPLAGLTGCGMHTHQGLLDPDGGGNLFHDAADRYRLSPVARHFVAGQLEHAAALAAVTAPLVNSYKRLVGGYEAPTHVSWAHSSRSALVRVPRTSRSDAEATRIELRCPDPSCNPYLAFAAMLSAGLDGIEQELPLMPPDEEQAHHLDAGAAERRYVRALPASLPDALDALQSDDVIADALGADMVQRFVEAKLIEWEEYRAHVSDWEVSRYLSLH